MLKKEDTISKLADAMTRLRVALFYSADRGLLIMNSCLPDIMNGVEFDKILKIFNDKFKGKETIQKKLAEDVQKDLTFIRNLCEENTDARQFVTNDLEETLDILAINQINAVGG